MPLTQIIAIDMLDQNHFCIEVEPMVQVQTQIPHSGDSAPDFTLNDTNMKPVSLHDFRGKTVILVFFPAAFTGVCTKELCTFRDNLARLNEANAQVLGISVDLPYSLAQFKESQQLTFPLLSDFDHQIIREYGVVDANFHGYTMGVARRSVFIIDPKGTVTWQWIADHPGQQPNYDEVLQTVASQ